MKQLFNKRLSVLVSVLLLAFASSAMAGEKKTVHVDQQTGLKMAPGWDVVKTNCTVCHSAKFITGQRGDRNTWESMIRWMQRTQGLWSLPDETEKVILDYLATNYPPGKALRRANLPASLMPGTTAKAP